MGIQKLTTLPTRSKRVRRSRKGKDSLRATGKFLAELEPYSDKVTLVDKEFSTNECTRFMCVRHNEEFECIPYVMIRRLRKRGSLVGCRACRQERRKGLRTKRFTTFEDYRARLGRINPDVIPLKSETWMGLHKPYPHKCLIHNHIWTPMPYNLLKENQKGCKKCWADTINVLPNRYCFKNYKLGKRIVRVQGYENKGLDYIQSHWGIQAKDIVVSTEKKVPVINWKDDYGKHRHYPDIYIPCKNMIVEVKSGYTFGFADRETYSKIRAKKKASIRMGYRYKVLVFAMDPGRGAGYINKVPLPKGWWKLSYRSIRRWYRGKGREQRLALAA